MEIIGNALNGHYFAELMRRADDESLEFIRAAVTYTTKPDPLIDLAKARRVTLKLYTLLDGDRFPPRPVLTRFIDQTGPGIQLFVTRNFFRSKIYWFGGVGVYIGSANLTDPGWNSNLECGIWFDQDDISEQGLEPQLWQMFEVVAKRCTPAGREHMALLDGLKADRNAFAAQRKQFEAMVGNSLASLPGQSSPIDPTKGGAAQAAFINEWESTLTDLLKIVAYTRARRQPAWVLPDTHPAFIQDQATEHWYHENIRLVGQDQIEVLHRRNRERIDVVLEELFDEWESFTPQEQTKFWTNDAPRLLQSCLSQEQLKDLEVDHIETLLRHSHSMRETVRHLQRSTLRRAGAANFEMEERYRHFAEHLANVRNAQHRDLGEVLQYVIWGDAETPRCAERVWNALYDPAWRFPHIGEHTLNELIGYARPDEFPPRNNRVRKTLRALGFDHH